ncbi:PEP-CTERM sorting domain-containing protein [Duganella sp. BJB488]|uniref:MHFG family PEP-CTERM protein n=1 Tax=unclassified Duganella TaxID=2636909 RepID=UPI000E35112C|nr:MULTISPECIES: MHFG family PEP-CTERM protein [unclassified Duganella]NVD69652.1 PEP-CTERM sorting domain-containing protein [Duganella sp. BJB1802]RFP10330.1 PEP-CTERM sorting domain-containing protein [Duganella sp. BJB489]RFP18077.1 PEP-CTERM sorting domain-containing protein [Duganella sp. BJB488]RFP37832.1 PEP-CTERM sorting domain-containing protein [Duganella sp. BJB480]
MSILLAMTLAAASTVQPSCSWDHPGVNPYTGKTSAAIDRYTDIPDAVRSTLKRRMEEGQSDDKVTITRDGIAGKNQYDPTIRDMHFGAASVCTTVTRGKWSPQRQEPGAVYCVGEHCILVPKICGNVSRITRKPDTVAKAPVAPPPVAKLGNKVGNKDLGLVDAEPVEPEEAEPADRTSQQRQAALDAFKQINPPGVEEFNLPEKFEFETDPDGNLVVIDPHPLTPFLPHGGDDGISPGPSAVPEADTWAMLLAGLGILGVAARRRQRRQPG